MGKKGEAAKEKIRAAAWELFAEKGYTEASMQELCQRCGLSKGGLYRHYADKADVFTDLLRALQAGETAREAQGMAQGSGAGELLAAYLRHTAAELERGGPNVQRALYEFCLEQRAGAGPQLLAQQYERGEAALLVLVEYGVARGEFRVRDARGTVAAILFLVEGLRMAREVMPLPGETLQGALRQIPRLLGMEAADEA